MADDYNAKVARTAQISRLSAETSEIIDEAKELVLKHFGKKPDEAPNLVVEIANIMSSRELGHAIEVQLFNGFSSIENSINGK